MKIEHWFLGILTKLEKATTGLVMSVCLHGTTMLPLNKFLRNFIPE
jgi:hypothetical protein